MEETMIPKMVVWLAFFAVMMIIPILIRGLFRFIYFISYMAGHMFCGIMGPWVESISRMYEWIYRVRNPQVRLVVFFPLLLIKPLLVGLIKFYWIVDRFWRAAENYFYPPPQFTVQ